MTPTTRVLVLAAVIPLAGCPLGTEDDDDTRDAVLSLYAPSEPAAPHKQVPLTDGSGTLTVKPSLEVIYDAV